MAGTITVGDGKHAVNVGVDPAGIAGEALRVQATPPSAAGAAPGSTQVIDFALATAPDAALGFDVKIDQPGAPITWQLFLDDAPWPEDCTFAGPFGLPAIAARGGITSDEAKDELYAPAPPAIDPARDLGVFFTRNRPGGAETGTESPLAPPPSPEAAKEMQRMLQQWGYAHKSAPSPAAARARTQGEK